MPKAVLKPHGKVADLLQFLGNGGSTYAGSPHETGAIPAAVVSALSRVIRRSPQGGSDKSCVVESECDQCGSSVPHVCGKGYLYHVYRDLGSSCPSRPHLLVPMRCDNRCRAPAARASTLSDGAHHITRRSQNENTESHHFL